MSLTLTDSVVVFNSILYFKVKIKNECHGDQAALAYIANNSSIVLLAENDMLCDKEILPGESFGDQSTIITALMYNFSMPCKDSKVTHLSETLICLAYSTNKIIRSEDVEKSKPWKLSSIYIPIIKHVPVSFKLGLTIGVKVANKSKYYSRNAILISIEYAAECDNHPGFYCEREKSCIAEILKCNGIQNCVGNEDETNCSQPKSKLGGGAITAIVIAVLLLVGLIGYGGYVYYMRNIV